MFKKTLLNIFFTGIVQLISLLVILYLASVMSTETFGTLSIQLSAATVISIVCTLQFERVYVRVSTQNLAKYVAFHLRVFLLVVLCLIIISINFKLGPSSVALAGSMGLTQIAVYALARKGMLRRIWVLKSVQGISLLIVTMLVFRILDEEYLWLSFFFSYLFAGFLVIDTSILKLLFSIKLRNDIRRCRYSQHIAFISLASLLTGTFTREFPVLLCGLIGQPSVAGTIGLVMRIVGAPIGLIARSTSAVVASYVSQNKFNIKEMQGVLIVPILSSIVIIVAISVDSMTSYMSKFHGFSMYLMIISPYLLIRSYVGLLGSVIVYHNLQISDLISNSLILTSALLSGFLAYYKLAEIKSILIVISITSTILGLWLINLTYKKVKIFSNERYI